MALLADYLLDVDGEIFGTSPPEQGDVPRALDGEPVPPGPRVSLGVSTIDVPRLSSLQRKAGWLMEQNGTKGLWIRIERLDPDLKVLVGTVLSEKPVVVGMTPGALDAQAAKRPS
jgi:hypothetical protein